MHSSAPSIAAVIATREAASNAARAVASVLASRSSALELCVVDQRKGSSPPELLAAARDPRARVVSVEDHGLAAARNAGIAHTSAPIIAFTDDDCGVDPGWLVAMTAAFAEDARVGVVFGTVRPADYDRTAGMVQAYEVRAPRIARGVAMQWTVNGIGACMAVRRSIFGSLGGFDERFGAGAPLRAAEDNDLVLRALLAGHWVSETPGAIVTHFGFRAWKDVPPLIESYMFGLGAMHAKMARLAGLAAVRPTASLAWRWLAGRPAADLNHQPPRRMRLAAFMRGVSAGWRPPIDRTTGCYASARPLANTLPVHSAAGEHR